MQNCKFILITILLLNFLLAEDSIVFHNADQFLLEGSKVEVQDKENYYDRLPGSLKELVREPVWQLSKNSAGMSVRFRTNSTKITVRWELLNDFHMNHMAGTGIRGLDLYCHVNGAWQYVKTAIPQKKNSERQLIQNMAPSMREFKLYLPLYDGLTNLEIGIDSLSQISTVSKDNRLPIVFYGTSITQGGCASRSGMAYTNIISRKLNRECINLGFSGNGRMEKEIAEYISSINAKFIVIDCLPNMKSEDVRNNLYELVKIIRRGNDKVPIVFVENIIFDTAYFDQNEMKTLREKNQTLKSEFENLVDQNIDNIFYISSDYLLRNDHESTVDGVHLTDLGFMHISENFIKHFQDFGLLENE